MLGKDIDNILFLINLTDEKLENKLSHFIHFISFISVKIKLKTMESCIKQNNAIEIYQDYFNEIDEATDCEEPKAKVFDLIFSERERGIY